MLDAQDLHKVASADLYTNKEELTPGGTWPAELQHDCAKVPSFVAQKQQTCPFKKGISRYNIIYHVGDLNAALNTFVGKKKCKFSAFCLRSFLSDTIHF